MHRSGIKIIALVFGVFLFGISGAYAQNGDKKKRKKTDQRDKYNTGAKKEKVIPRSKIYQRTGWLVAPGLTYTWPGKWDQEFTATFPSGNVSDYYERTRGRFGFYLEGGRYHIFQKSKLFRYFDYGIALKSFSGAEFVTDSLVDPSGNPINTTDYKGKYTELNVDGFININNTIQLSKKLTLQNSLGLNVDYRFLGSSRYQIEPNGGDNVLDLNQYVDQPSPLRFQLHYKIGVGFRTNPFTVVIPTLEVPLMSFLPGGNLNPTFQYFNSRYLPLILSVRIMFLRKHDKNSCPPVYSRDVEGVVE